MSSNEVMTFMSCPWGPEVAQETHSICPGNGRLNCHLPVIFDKQQRVDGTAHHLFSLALQIVHGLRKQPLLFFLEMSKIFLKSICAVFGIKPIQLKAVKVHSWCSRHQKHYGSLSEKLKIPTGN